MRLAALGVGPIVAICYRGDNATFSLRTSALRMVFFMAWLDMFRSSD